MPAATSLRTAAVHWMAIIAGVAAILARPDAMHTAACADDDRVRVSGPAGARMYQLEQQSIQAINDGMFTAASDFQNELLEIAVTQFKEDDWRLKGTRAEAIALEKLANLSGRKQDENRGGLKLFKTGKLHLIRQRWEQSSIAFEQAATIFREHLGTENLLYCDALTELASALSKAGNYDRARQVLQQIAASKRVFLGDDQPSYGKTLKELGKVECELGDFDSAEGHLLRALEIREQQFGGEFRDTVFALQEVAAMYLKKSDPQSAEKYAGRAVEITSRTMSPWNATRILSQWRLAQCRAARNDLAQAEQIYHQIVPEFEQLTCTVEAADAAEIIKDYATVLSRLSKDDESARMLDWARTIRSSGVGAERPRGGTN